MKKTKLAAANYPIPQTDEEANDFIARIGMAQRERTRLEAKMNDRLAGTKQYYADQARPYAAEIETLSQGLRDWAAVNREKLTKGNKVKFARLAAGELLWRSRPPKVTIRNLEKVLDALKIKGLSRFIRIKEEPDKEAMLKEPDIAQKIKGISIGSEGEDFVIKPFETQLEEVA